MVKVKRTWTEFKDLVDSKGLLIFYGDNSLNSYDLLAIDGKVCYQCLVHKNGTSDQIDYESNYMASVSAYLNDEPSWDEIQTSCPSSDTTLHTYLRGGAVIQTILVTYSGPSKKEITRVQRSLV